MAGDRWAFGAETRAGEPQTLGQQEGFVLLQGSWQCWLELEGALAAAPAAQGKAAFLLIIIIVTWAP